MFCSKIFYIIRWSEASFSRQGYGNCHNVCEERGACFSSDVCVSLSLSMSDYVIAHNHDVANNVDDTDYVLLVMRLAMIMMMPMTVVVLLMLVMHLWVQPFCELDDAFDAGSQYLREWKDREGRRSMLPWEVEDDDCRDDLENFDYSRARFAMGITLVDNYKEKGIFTTRHVCRPGIIYFICAYEEVLF
jgi:hypothetical protein